MTNKEMTKVQALELAIDVIGKVIQGETYDELLEKLEKEQIPIMYRLQYLLKTKNGKK